MKYPTIVFLTSAVMMFVYLAPAVADLPANKGLEIAIESDLRDSGWEDSEADLVMVLKNRHGQENTRYVRVRNLEVAGAGDRSLAIFDLPTDIKGTAVLTWSHALKASDQWIFLPALKRTKRIASRNKSGPFMGSEFAYEDIISYEVNKYTYKYLRDEACGEKECFVIERIPQYEYSGYTKQEVWMDKEHYRNQKIVFYDRKGALLKTLVAQKYEQYLGKYWRALNIVMENHQTGKSTILQWNNYRFASGLTEEDFNQNSLKRAR